MVMPMDQSTTTTHSFIVKIWLEETAEDARRVMWRGHITHVLSRRRRYLKNLDDVVAFIASYLDGVEGTPGFFRRIRQWFTDPDVFC